MKLFLVIVFTSFLFAQHQIYWGEEGAEVILETFGGRFAPAVETGDGGVIAVWNDTRGSGMGGNIYAQKLDSISARVWDTAGVLIAEDIGFLDGYPCAVSDGAGGAIVLWMESIEVNAVRVDVNGTVLWQTQVCYGWWDFAYLNAASDGMGGVIITWTDDREDQYMWDIYVQRVNADGGLEWPEEVLLTDDHRVDCRPYDLQTFPDHACAIVAWTHFVDGQRDILARRIDYSGSLGWSLSVCDDTSQQYIKMTISTSDSVFIAWNDLRNGDSDPYLQLVDLMGTSLLGANGIPVAIGSGVQAVRYITEGNPGEVIVAIEDRSGPMKDLFLQKVNSMGQFPWGNPVYISSPADSDRSFNVALTSDGAGGTVASWRQYRSDTGDFYAQHVDSSGTCVWESGRIDLSLSPYNQHRGPQMCSDAKGGAIIVWEEDRPGDQWGSVYAQRIGDILCGDADGNGAVTSADGYWILNYLGVGPPPVSTWAANVNGDGQITPADGYQLLNWLGSSGELNCGGVQ